MTANFSMLCHDAEIAVRYRRLGEGAIDFVRVNKVLTESGFDGWIFIDADETGFDREQAAAWYSLQELKRLGSAAA